MDDQTIADALVAHRKYLKEEGYNVGRGCPFGELGYTLHTCCSVCVYLFPSLEEQGNPAGIDCPCFQLNRKYVIRRCNKFVREVMTNG